MSANTTADASGSDKPKSAGKKLIVIGGLVVVLALVAGAVLMVLQSRRAAASDEDGGGSAASSHAAERTAPTFLPLENMVVNLADPGGDRFAQVGITLELADAKTAEQVKQYLPTIRSGILMLVSQRTSTELLTREGKEKLASDILREVSRPLGYTVPRKSEPKPADADGEDDPPPVRRANPIRRVLFSSFIVQ